jgi:hypothetical protein
MFLQKKKEWYIFLFYKAIMLFMLVEIVKHALSTCLETIQN